MKKYRQIETYKYFESFFVELPQPLKDKYIWTFQLIEELDRVPKNYLKHIEDGIYEIRVSYKSNHYRTFCFFEENQLIILANSIQKKTQKLRRRDLEKAKRIRVEYRQEKL